MYHALWEAVYAQTEPVRAEAILGAAHRLLAREGGEKAVVLAAAMLATAPKDERQALLEQHVEHDLHAEIHGILEHDPENTNTAIVHDAILLSEFHKNRWKQHGETPEQAITFLEELVPRFRTTSGKADAKRALSDRKADAAALTKGTIPQGAQRIGSETEGNESEEEPIKAPEGPRSAMNKPEGTPSEPKIYHWADKTAQRIIEEKGEKALYTVAAGITPSGVVHFGNFREIITNDLIVKALERRGKKVRFIYSWDDYDTFRKVPKNLPDQEKFKEFLFQPTTNVPDPFGCGHGNYADHFKAEIMDNLPAVGVFPEFLHQSKKYKACEYADGMRHALRHRDEIRAILNEFKTEDISPDWWPLSVYCQSCGRDRTTRVTGYDGEYGVTYECQCGHRGSFDLRKEGIAKLPWRVDWPMRWHHEQVDFEPGGKDHSSQGGSYDSGKIISKQIWNYDAPTYIMYDFISFKGMKGKMSSSKGEVIRLSEVLSIYTPEVVRFLFAGTRPDAEFSVSFDTDAFKTYEDFDTVERKYFAPDESMNEKDRENARRIYELSVLAPPPKQPIQPSFRHLATYVQLAEGDLDKVVSMMSHEIRDEYDEARVRRRALCAWNWVREHAPEQYRFTLAVDEPHAAAQSLTAPVKAALRQLAAVLAGQDEETLTELFRQIAEAHGIQTMDFFAGAYKALVGKDRGPKLASLITQTGHERVARVLGKVA